MTAAPAGGYRLHVVLFNNATNMINADNPVRELGTYWEEKIEGGMYWQQFQSPYKQFGCCMFYPSDEHFRDFLVEGLTRFLVKNDVYFRPQLPAGMSDLAMFGLGEQPRRPTAPNGLDSPLNWRGSGWRRHVYDHAADWGMALPRS